MPYRHFEILLGELLNEDAATISFKLTPSSTDVGPYSDANTESLKLTPLLTAEEHATYDAVTETFALVASGTDAATFVDADTELFKFTITGHDCFAHITPEYQIDLFKRWNLDSTMARWDVSSLSQRWGCFIIGTAFEIPC